MVTKYVRKADTVEARQHEGSVSLPVYSIRKGEQTAHIGDFLVHDPEEVAKVRQREKDEGLEEGSLQLHRGSIYVVSKEEFLKDYEPAGNGDAESDSSDKFNAVKEYEAKILGPQLPSKDYGEFEGQIIGASSGNRQSADEQTAGLLGPALPAEALVPLRPVLLPEEVVPEGKDFEEESLQTKAAAEVEAARHGELSAHDAAEGPQLHDEHQG